MATEIDIGLDGIRSLDYGYEGVDMLMDDDSVFTPELADEAAAAAEEALAQMGRTRTGRSD